MIRGKRKPGKRLTMEDIRKKSKKIIAEQANEVTKNEAAEIVSNAVGNILAGAQTVKEAVKGPSRATLMQQAKDRGIKYFRILNKTELKDVLSPNNTDALKDRVVEAAKSRWKAGWTKNKTEGAQTT